MPSRKRPFSFKRVLAELPRGEPLGTVVLRKHGVSAFRASALARSGWLTHLGRGVYMLPGDTLTRDGCLAYLSQEVPGLHVGGKTALAWRGIRQNISFREVLNLWGSRPKRLPVWFTQRFPSHYQATQLFDTQLHQGFGLQPLPNGRQEILVSVPERALLELLSDVGKTQSLLEARQLIEGVRTLREKTLDELLAHVTRIKVVRLAEVLAKDLDLPWASTAQRHSQRIGGGKRWVAVTRTGERLEGRMNHWPLQDAKARFSELVRKVRSDGPQHVTVHGRDEVVVIAAEEFRRLKGGGTGRALVDVMQASPHRDVEIEPSRGSLPVRDVPL
jgi:prevent-host-death family protein